MTPLPTHAPESSIAGWDGVASARFRPEPLIVETGVPEEPRRHCNHCPARFWTVWERVEHERERHPEAGISPAPCVVCGGDCSASNPPPSYCPDRDGPDEESEPTECGLSDDGTCADANSKGGQP
jgi:hypothetical protein